MEIFTNIICPITLDKISLDNLVCSSTGYLYDKVALNEYIRTNNYVQDRYTCPVTRTRNCKYFKLYNYELCNDDELYEKYGSVCKENESLLKNNTELCKNNESLLNNNNELSKNNESLYKINKELNEKSTELCKKNTELIEKNNSKQTIISNTIMKTKEIIENYKRINGELLKNNTELSEKNNELHINNSNLLNEINLIKTDHCTNLDKLNKTEKIISDLRTEINKVMTENTKIRSEKSIVESENNNNKLLIHELKLVKTDSKRICTENYGIIKENELYIYGTTTEYCFNNRYYRTVNHYTTLNISTQHPLPKTCGVLNDKIICVLNFVILDNINQNAINFRSDYDYDYLSHYSLFFDMYGNVHKFDNYNDSCRNPCNNRIFNYQNSLIFHLNMHKFIQTENEYKLSNNIIDKIKNIKQKLLTIFNLAKYKTYDAYNITNVTTHIESYIKVYMDDIIKEHNLLIESTYDT
jgi:hypothetical protein